MNRRSRLARTLILFYVQHLLGAGHLYRVHAVTRALAARGQAVRIVNGGPPTTSPAPRGVGVLQLEPLRSDGLDFARIVDRDGNEAGVPIFERRAARLKQYVQELDPETLVIESWPFGRRPFRRELLPLLDDCRNAARRPRIVCSIRDVLHRRAAKRERETASLIERYFDYVLVHGDPGVVPLEASFGHCDAIRDKLVYTGYVAPAPLPQNARDAPRGDEILVSAGSSAAGMTLYRAALDAALADDSGARWRVLVGGGVGEAEFRALRERAARKVVVERNRDDFHALLARCAALVAQAGYNTMMDVLASAAPALLAPFEGSGETEQLQRARCFEALGACRVIRESELTGARILTALSSLLRDGGPVVPAVDLDGAERSADFLARLAR